MRIQSSVVIAALAVSSATICSHAVADEATLPLVPSCAIARTVSNAGVVSVSEVGSNVKSGKFNFSLNVDGKQVVIQNGEELTYIGSVQKQGMAGGGSATTVSPANLFAGETAIYDASALPDGKVLVKVRYETLKLIRIDPVKIGDESIQAPVTDKTRYENAVILTRGQAASLDVPVAGGQLATIVLSRPA